MIEHRELISICRQIGSMMEAGVDILRVTRVLRAQTDNPRILAAYDKLDHDLRMGQSLGEAMEAVPELFSPFAVSLVRQGEARNDIAGAFFKIADFLQKEDEVAVTHQNDNVGASTSGASTPANDANRYPMVTPSAILPVWVIDDLLNRLQVAALQLFTVLSGLLLTLAAVWGSVEAGWVEKRWQNVVLCSVAALFIGGAGVWLRRSIETDRKRELERRHFLETEAARVMDEPEAASAPVLSTHDGRTPVASAPLASDMNKIASDAGRSAPLFPDASAGALSTSNPSSKASSVAPPRAPASSQGSKTAREATFE